MKINIIIYHKDNSLADELQRFTASVLFNANFSATIKTYLYAEQIKIGMLEIGKNTDILIAQADDEGYGLGNALRSINSSFVILYIAEDLKNVLSAFRSMPMAYVLRSDEKKSLALAILRASQWVMRTKKIFQYESRTQLLQITYNEILYFESEYRVVHIHKLNGSRETINYKLDDLQKDVPADTFCRCHKSYLVNRNYIKKINKSDKTIELQTGVTIYISKAMYPGFLRLISGGEWIEFV